VIGYNGTDDLPSVLKNECGVPDKSVATVNYATVIFVIVCVLLMGLYLNRQAAIFDEHEQTAQDYSIVITKPPSDAIDPVEWRFFFCGAV
jgi:hypothetical protein